MQTRTLWLLFCSHPRRFMSANRRQWVFTTSTHIIFKYQMRFNPLNHELGGLVPLSQTFINQTYQLYIICNWFNCKLTQCELCNNHRLWSYCISWFIGHDENDFAKAQFSVHNNFIWLIVCVWYISAIWTHLEHICVLLLTFDNVEEKGSHNMQLSESNYFSRLAKRNCGNWRLASFSRIIHHMLWIVKGVYCGLLKVLILRLI